MGDLNCTKLHEIALFSLLHLGLILSSVMNFLINQTTRRAFPMAQRTFQTTAKTMFSDGFWDAPKLTYKDIKPLTKAPTEVSSALVERYNLDFIGQSIDWYVSYNCVYTSHNE